MEFKMLLVKVGVFLIYFMKPALLAKDTMELSPYTFHWEDAEARCARQGEILAPGRRYRAKMIKKLMVQSNIDAVWLNGWRAVSDINPDKDGKLRTLKVDFSRPHSKKIKMICQFPSAYYDPTYKAESSEIARAACKRDTAELADVTSADNVTQITKDMIEDSPHWINSISSKGSKIKQCLVATLAGKDLKYSYEDCSKELNIICVKGDDIISSFSPLIALKMAKFEEFENEIEKHTQSMISSSETFHLFPSSEMSMETSSVDITISETSSIQPSFASEVVTPSFQSEITSSEVIYSVNPQQTSADVTSSSQYQITSESVTSSFQPLVTPADLATKVQPFITSDAVTSSKIINATSSVEVYEEDDTSIIGEIEPTPAYTEMTSTSDEPTVISGDIVSFLPFITNNTFSIKTSEVQTTKYFDDFLPSSTPEVITIQETSNVKYSTSSSQIIESSSIDIYYRESVFIEPESFPSSERSISDIVSPSVEDEILSTIILENLSPSIIDTGYKSATDMPIKTINDPIVVTTQTPTLSSSFYYQIYDTVESEETMPLDNVDSEEISTIQATSVSVFQTTDVLSQPSSTNTIASSDSKASFNTISDPIIHFTFTSSLQDFMAIESTSTYESQALAPNTVLIETTSKGSLSSDECLVIDSSTLCGDEILISKSAYTSDDHEFSSTTSIYVTPSMTYSMTDDTSSPSSTISTSSSSTSSSSTLSSSAVSLTSSSPPVSRIPAYDYFEYEDDLKTLGPKPSMSTVIPSSSDIYDNYSQEYDTVEENEDQTLPPIAESTPDFSMGTSDEDETKNIDENIPGDLDEDDMDEDNEVGNASAGEIVEKKEDDEDEGIEVGLWVAFAILITLVLVALIVAAILYKKRKQQKSKDINDAAPPAASGETVELRDSRSPSRENGKPRESTTFKDPAYDI